ncbi:hypothetical protein GMSM_15670 [Geomonas sp. Red276]
MDHDSGSTGIGLGGSDVLEVCEAVELRCAELYHYFAELFKAEREPSHLWLKLAMEEENQARLFALLFKLRRSNIIVSVGIELVEAEVALLYVLSVMEKAMAAPPTLEEAILIALDLKSKLSRFMPENSIVFADSSYEKSFRNVNTPVEDLREAFGRLSLPPGRRPANHGR